MFKKLSIDFIYQICIFCQFEDIYNLMKTCKSLNQIIPKEWTYYSFSVFKSSYKKNTSYYGKKIMSYDKFDNISLNKCKFIKYFSINFLHFSETLKSTKNSIILSNRLERLTDIDILYVRDIENIYIESHKNLKEINIQSCSDLKNVILHDNMNKLELINISNSPIQSLSIKSTLINLKTLVLVGTNITEVYIPKECTNLGFINVSGSAIKKIIYDRTSDNSEKSLILCYYMKNGKIDIYKHVHHPITIIPNEDNVNFYFLPN